MANWCVGDLKIRGNSENLIRFLTECIEGCAAELNKYGELEIKNIRGQSIKGLRRTHCENNQEIIECYDINGIFTACIHINSAWALSTPELMQLSKDFGVDFRFYGFERGQEFNQEVEVINGKLTLDKCIEFDDYLWQCPLPNWGG